MLSAIYKREMIKLHLHTLSVKLDVFTSAFVEVLILRVISLARSLDRSLTPVTQKLK